MQMNVSIPPKMYDLVQEKVKMGMYSNASEVVRDALRRLDTSQRETEAWSKLNSLLTQAEQSGRSKLDVNGVVEEVIEKNK